MGPCAKIKTSAQRAWQMQSDILMIDVPLARVWGVVWALLRTHQLIQQVRLHAGLAGEPSVAHHRPKVQSRATR
jgi:hypothetical protein